MHRFKFRVFDKETGKYYKTKISKGSGCMVYQHPASSHYEWVQIGTMFAELERDEKTYALTKLEPDFIIEQCTGLKDENGKLIYEGDIVYDNGINEFGVIVFNEAEVKFGVQYDDDFCDFSYGLELKIYGNIHENKYLLEANND